MCTIKIAHHKEHNWFEDYQFLDAPAKLVYQKGCHILKNADLVDNSDCFQVYTGTMHCTTTPHLACAFCS